MKNRNMKRRNERERKMREGRKEGVLVEVVKGIEMFTTAYSSVSATFRLPCS